MPSTSNRKSVPGGRRFRWIRRGFLTLCALLVLPSLSAPSAAAVAMPTEDPTVISEWNALAVTTLVSDPTKQAPETVLYLGFVQAAVFDAVVGINGRYQSYLLHHRAPAGSSAQAAAVAAAHEVLLTYSQYAQAALDAAYATSLARIPDGKSKTHGIAFGIEAAHTLINSRIHDGRNAPVLFTQPPAPGVWRPTPPALTLMLDPWLGGVRPLLVRSATQFAPPPPPSLTSRRYTRDLDEVKAFGSETSTVRTPDQTSTAMFFSGSAIIQYNASLRDQMAVRHLNLTDAARMFAAIDMTSADALITVWRAKLFYGFWRPITAINLADTDGNPATIADPNWEPLVATPAYPEYPSGYNVLTAAFTGGLDHLFKTDRLNITLISSAVPDVRHYDSGRAVRADVVNARVWLGFHFRTSDITSRNLGLRLADWTLSHYFQPRSHGRNDR
jgi:hypothetical protein